MRACNCSSRKSNAGAQLAITVPESGVLESVGTILPTLFYHSLDSDLRAGRGMSTVSNGKIISVAEANRMVARARAQGWLPPYSPTI